MRHGLLAGLVGLSLLADSPEAQAKQARQTSKPASIQGPAPSSSDELVVPQEREEPALVEATATVWAQAGSRSWTDCSKTASEARRQLLNEQSEEINNFAGGHRWEHHVGHCPNAPEVLSMAAQVELLRRFDLPEALDDKTDLTLLESEQAASRARALAWIDAAQAELDRRRDKHRLRLEYWRARALLASGDVEGAHRALHSALREGTIEGWKIRRLLALTELFAGDLEAALWQAKRASIDAPPTLGPGGARLFALYVIALVLDRAGDTAAAERYMKSALDMDGDRSQMRALESTLPTHERLYLRAYAHTVRRESAGALRMWAAYLARPEPEAPERRLAERHRDALQPLPSNLGGPPRADEGKAAAGQAGSNVKAP